MEESLWIKQKAKEKRRKIMGIGAIILSIIITALFISTMFMGEETKVGSENINREVNQGNIEAGEYIYNNYTIDGDRVYWNDERVYISATPHTITKRDWVYFNVTSKVYTGDVDIILGFDTTKLKPIKAELYNPHMEVNTISYTCEGNFDYNSSKYYWCYDGNETLVKEGIFEWGNLATRTIYWNESHIENWVGIEDKFNKISYDYAGMNTWYYSKELPIIQDQEYLMRIAIDVKTTSGFEVDKVDSKYWFAIKRSDDTLQQAITNDRLYALDPFVNSTGGDAGLSFLEDDLMFWYNLEDNDTITDDGTGVYNGTGNGAVLQIDGVIGNGIYTGVSDYVAIADIDLYELTTCGWANATDLSTYRTYWAKNRDTSWGMGYNTDTTKMRWRVRTDAVKQVESTFNPTASEWYFLCGVYNGTTSLFYINGYLNASTYSGATLNVNNDDIQLGKDADSIGYQGGLDNVALWNTTLNATTIADMWNEGLGIEYGTGSAPSSDPENITISAVSDANSVAIDVFNVTGNWTAGTTNGSILTENEINSTYYTYNISSLGFVSNETEQNDSFTISLTPLGFGSPYINLTNSTLLVGGEINMSCNYTDYMTEYENNITYWINNTDDNSQFSQSGGTYTILATDFRDTLQFWCEIENAYYGTNSSSKTLGGADRTITFNALSSWGGLISSVIYNFTELGINHTGNPYSEYMSEFLNETQNGLNTTIYIEDLTYYNQDLNDTILFNETEDEYNLTLTSNQLVLEFFDVDGNADDVKFEIADENGVFANDSSSVVVVQRGLSEGIVKVVFNEDDYGANWTQFYEYDNDFETHITEELTVLNGTADWVAYFEVLDYGNSPIHDATIRAEYTGVTAGQTNNYTLIGQRLTEQDGKTFFWFDSSTYILLTITAEGYTPVEKILRIGDESASTKSLAIPIYLEESSTGVENNMWVYLPKYVNNKSEDISGLIMHKTADQVKITTSYREGLGLGQTELNSDGYGRYYFTLESGQDFDTGAGDIVIYIYIDGTLVKTWTIEEKEITRIFDLPDIDDDIEVVVGSIALVFISGAVGSLTTSVTTGFTIFMVGSLLMSLLNPAFLWLSAVSAMYFLLKVIRRVFME